MTKTKRITKDIFNKLISFGDFLSVGIDNQGDVYRAYINYSVDAEMGGNWSAYGRTPELAAQVLLSIVESYKINKKKK